MDSSDQIFGAIIGASAAVAAQVVASIANFISQKRHLSLISKEIHVQARNELRAKRIDALCKIRELILVFQYNSTKPQITYEKIIPFAIFLDSKLEKMVNEAILAKTPNSEHEKPPEEADRMIEEVLGKLRVAIHDVDMEDPKKW